MTDLNLRDAHPLIGTDMLLLLALAALAAGVYVAVRQHPRHGWLYAVLAGAGAVVGLVLLTLVTLITLQPLAILATTGCIVGALNSYDRGRVFVATLWTGAAGVCLWCAGWAW